MGLWDNLKQSAQAQAADAARHEYDTLATKAGIGTTAQAPGTTAVSTAAATGPVSTVGGVSPRANVLQEPSRFVAWVRNNPVLGGVTVAVGALAAWAIYKRFARRK